MKKHNHFLKKLTAGILGFVMTLGVGAAGYARAAGETRAADSGLQPADGKFIIDFYDSTKLSSTNGTGLTSSNYSTFVKVASGLTKTNVVTGVSVTGTVQYGKNGGLTAGSGTAAGPDSHYVTFNIGSSYAVNKCTVYATKYEDGKWQLNGYDADSGSLGNKGAAFSNVTDPYVWNGLNGVTSLTFKKMATGGGNNKRLTLYTIVCEYSSDVPESDSIEINGGHQELNMFYVAGQTPVSDSTIKYTCSSTDGALSSSLTSGSDVATLSLSGGTVTVTPKAVGEGTYVLKKGDATSSDTITVKVESPIVEITGIASGAPTSIEVGKTIDPSTITLNAKRANNDTLTVTATSVECDTSVAAQSVQGKAIYSGISDTTKNYATFNVRVYKASIDSVTFVAGTDISSSSPLTKEGISIYGSTFSRDDNYRFNSGSEVTVSCDAGLVEINFTCTGSNTSDYGPGKMALKNTSQNGSYSYSGKIGTWKANGECTSVTFKTSAQVRATEIVVKIKSAGEKYAITFDGGIYGTGDGPEASEASENAEYILPANSYTCSQEHYHFNGWLSDSDSQIYQPEASFTMPGQAVKFTAQWAEDTKYSITYVTNADGGVTPTHESVYAGTKFDLATATDLQKTGYAFVGWKYNNVTYASGYKDFEMPASNVTFAGQWSEQITVSFTSETGKEPTGMPNPSIITVGKGSTLTKPSDPVLDGSSFIGWFNSATDTLWKFANDVNPDTVQSTTTLVAKFALNHTVTYDIGNGTTGTVPTQSPVGEGMKFFLASSSGFEKAGMTFDGWSDGIDTYAAGSEYTMGQANIVFTAIWSEKPQVIDYTITSSDNVSFSIVDSNEKVIATGTFGGGSPTPQWNATDSGVRVYAGGYLRITPAKNVEILKVKSTFINNKNNKNVYAVPKYYTGSKADESFNTAAESGTWYDFTSATADDIEFAYGHAGSAGNLAFKTVSIEYKMSSHIAVLTDVEVDSTNLVKQTQYVGAPFDYTGLVCTGVYDDESTEDINPADITWSELLENQSVTGTYNNINVTVEDVEISSQAVDEIIIFNNLVTDGGNEISSLPENSYSSEKITVGNFTKTYNGAYSTIRLGSSSNNGSFNLTYNNGSKKIGKIVVIAQAYYGGASSGYEKATLTIGDITKDIPTTLSEVEFDLSTKNITETPISTENTNRFRIHSLTIFPKDETFDIRFLNGDTVLQTSNLPAGATPAYSGDTPTKTQTDQYSYSFKGWSTDGKTVLSSIPAVTGAADYYAVFDSTIRSYKVTWKNYDGEDLKIDSDVPYGTKPSCSVTPSKESDEQYSYSFSGWSTSTTSETIYSNDDMPKVTGDHVYYARFTPVLEYAKITFMNEGKQFDETLVKVGNSLNLSEYTPTKAGYKLTGWKDQDNKLYDSTASINNINKDLILNAVWTEGTFTVTFDVNGGNPLSEGQSTKSVTYNSKLGELPTPTRDHYVFDGWYTAKGDNYGQKVDKDTVFEETKNTTYYAHWIYVYEVALDVNSPDATGGSLSKYVYSVSSEVQTITITDPIREGYHVTGYDITKGFEVTDNVITIPANKGGKITVTAQWEANPHTVTLKYSDSDTQVINTSYDTKFNLSEYARTEEGSYMVWKDQNGKYYNANEILTIKGDLVLTAEWRDIAVSIDADVGFQFTGLNMTKFEFIFTGTFDGDNVTEYGFLISKDESALTNCVSAKATEYDGVTTFVCDDGEAECVAGVKTENSSRVYYVTFYMIDAQGTHYTQIIAISIDEYLLSDDFNIESIDDPYAKIAIQVYIANLENNVNQGE